MCVCVMRTFYMLHSKLCEVKTETHELDYALEFVAIYHYASTLLCTAYIKDISSAPLAWQAEGEQPCLSYFVLNVYVCMHFNADCCIR